MHHTFVLVEHRPGGEMMSHSNSLSVRLLVLVCWHVVSVLGSPPLDLLGVQPVIIFEFEFWFDSSA